MITKGGGDRRDYDAQVSTNKSEITIVIKVVSRGKRDDKGRAKKWRFNGKIARSYYENLVEIFADV